MTSSGIFIFSLVLLLSGCKGHSIERTFFHKPPATRLERLRGLALPDQYKIYRYGMDFIEPPTMLLSGPIAERGAQAVPFLKKELRATEDFVTLRDILIILETMQTTHTYDVKDDRELMKILVTRDANVHDPENQKFCEEMILRIRNSQS